MKKLFKRLLKPFKKARKQAPRVRYIQDGVVRYANIDRLTVATLLAKVRQLEGEIISLKGNYNYNEDEFTDIHPMPTTWEVKSVPIKINVHD